MDSFLCLLFFCYFFYLSNCRFLHWNTAVFVTSKFYDYVFIRHINDYSVKSTCCKHCIAHFHSASICCTLFCSFFCGLIRKNQKAPKINPYTINIIPSPPPAGAAVAKAYILYSSYKLKHYCYHTQFSFLHQVVFLIL